MSFELYYYFDKGLIEENIDKEDIFMVSENSNPYEDARVPEAPMNIIEIPFL